MFHLNSGPIGCFAMRRIAFIFIALFASHCALAQSGVSASVHSVISGGYWQSGAQSGSYRVVLVNSGFEHVATQVFIEWVREPNSQAQDPVVVSSVEPKLPFGQGMASLDATLRPLANGKVKIVLTGVISVQPSQRVRASFTATTPGIVQNGG
jgi:hypothetical protein